VAALPPASAALVLAVDMPGVTVDLLAALAAYTGAGSVVPVDSSGQAQPLCARYSAAALRTAALLAADGTRAMRALLDATPWTAMAPAEWLPLAGAGGLTDVDLPADLAAFAGGGASP
jgi:molybdopterin-guanine dinucleotide biosynthesis protein A